MTFRQLLLYLELLSALFGTPRPPAVHAQAQKLDYPYQKSVGRESLEREPLEQEPMQQGGYQAPPPTGALQGATRQLGISGGEIELPAIRLRLPRIRLPAFSLFVTPPQMEMERAVAPLVQQVQEQVSVPAPRTEPFTAPTEPFKAPADVPDPVQKAQLQQHDSIRANRVQFADQSEQIARMQAEMVQFENRLEQKLARLTDSVELLVAQQTRERQTVNTNPKPLPSIEQVDISTARCSAYYPVESIRPVIGESSRLQDMAPQPWSQLRRLPPQQQLQLRRLPH